MGHISEASVEHPYQKDWEVTHQGALRRKVDISPPFWVTPGGHKKG